MRKRTVRDIDVSGKRALVRVDFNVPLTEEGEVADDLRIRAAIPTINYLREREARVILCSHLGRPKGIDPSLSLAPVARHLERLLGVPVPLAPDCVGPQAESAVAAIPPGGVLLLENLRFHPEEERNDTEFARALSSLGDIYVNDAFGAAHRAHASTAGVTAYLPAVAGLLMEKELDFLGRALTDPARPFAAVIGGAKISTKIAVLDSLLARVNKLIIGGGMANTFLKAEGFSVGDSLVEEDQIETARNIMEKASERNVQLLLPADVVVANRFASDADTMTAPVNDVPAGWQILDIGSKTVEVFARALQDCRTVLWNGPMGVFEMERFAAGTVQIARAIASLRDAVTIVGGGETAQAVQEMGLFDQFSHVSTGGGAALEFLEGRELPGVAALEDV